MVAHLPHERSSSNATQGSPSLPHPEQTCCPLVAHARSGSPCSGMLGAFRSGLNTRGCFDPIPRSAPVRGGARAGRAERPCDDVRPAIGDPPVGDGALRRALRAGALRRASAEGSIPVADEQRTGGPAFRALACPLGNGRDSALGSSVVVPTWYPDLPGLLPVEVSRSPQRQPQLCRVVCGGWAWRGTALRSPFPIILV